MSEQSMNAAIWIGDNAVETVSVPWPEVKPGWAVVEVAYNGICGTDLSILHGKHPRAKTGLTMGHELSGYVVKSGEGGPEVGALVVAEPLISCGKCGACDSGASHVCKNLGLYGIDAPGALAEYVSLPFSVLHSVPVSVDAKLAALVEPLAVAVHAVEQAEVQPGDKVVIAGGGPVGVLTALVAQHEGAGQIILSEPSATRRAIAKKYGFTVVEDGESVAEVALRETDGEGVDIFFDTAGHPSVTVDYTTATRVLGRIVVVGVHKVPAAIDLRDVCFKELDIRGVRVYTTENVRIAIALIASKEIDLTEFPIAVFSLSNVAQAFEKAGSGEDVLKVMVTPEGEKK